MEQTADVSKILREAVKSFLTPVLSQEIVQLPSVSSELLKLMAALGEIVVRGRADVPRDSYSRQIVGEPVIESNTRFPQQIAQVARGWAALSGRREANEEDYSLIYRVAFDSIPPVRAKVFQALMKGDSPSRSGAPGSTVNRALEDLAFGNGCRDSR
ncbi:MAG: hypothetical protein WCE63_22120 [Acidobacteriaceae bacterium]